MRTSSTVAIALALVWSGNASGTGEVQCGTISSGAISTSSGLIMNVGQAAISESAGCGAGIQAGVLPCLGFPTAIPNSADTNGDGMVDVLDLVQVIVAWGLCPDPTEVCVSDVNCDGAVNVQDLLAVILNWG